jgi:hypothetical protein
MLLGLPTILTGYSGTNDFATAKCAYLVDYELVPVQPGEYPGLDGQNWADAKIETAARHMRAIYERREEGRRIGELGKRAIKRQLAPSVIGPKLRDAVEELLSESKRKQVPAEAPRKLPARRSHLAALRSASH